MMRRINWQREVGGRRQMVEMVGGRVAGNQGGVEDRSWKTNEGKLKGMRRGGGTRSGDDGAEERKKRAGGGGERHNV